MATHNYEVHILIAPYQEKMMTDKFDVLKEKVKDSGLSIHPKKMSTATSTGENKRQPMITFTVVNQTEENVKNTTDLVEAIMTSDALGFKVPRIKIEQLLSRNHSGLTVSGDKYFESHVKIGDKIPDKENYKNIATICLKYGAQLVVNSYSTIIAPVTTFRKYDLSFDEFIGLHDQLIDDLKNAGFQPYKIHIEMGIVDTNVYTDRGWLFLEDYKTPITQVDEQRVSCPDFQTVF